MATSSRPERTSGPRWALLLASALLVAITLAAAFRGSAPAASASARHADAASDHVAATDSGHAAASTQPGTAVPAVLLAVRVRARGVPVLLAALLAATFGVLGAGERKRGRRRQITDVGRPGWLVSWWSPRARRAPPLSRA
ncbi:MAG: hypothetical protein HYX34_12470 [Actinobacteria bacterium]|nr:hypothetical protein [Actinomycetota bacterium]